MCREKSGLDCQPGKVEELTVRRATVADLLCWVLAQLSEAEAELVHMRDRAAAARASSVSGAPSAMHDSPWDAAPLDGCTAAGEHCAKPPASDGGCGAGFNSDLKVLSPEPVQAPVKTGSEVSGELLDSPRDATPPGVSPTGTERRARLPSEDGGAGLRLDAGIQVPSPTSEPAGCGGFDDGTAVAPRFDAGTGAAGETFADEVPAGEVEMLRLGGRAFVPPSRNGRLDVAPAGSGDFSGADPGPAKRPRGGYAGGGKAWGAGGEADPEQMHENPAFGLPDASVRLGASVIQFQELSSAFEVSSCILCRAAGCSYTDGVVSVANAIAVRSGIPCPSAYFVFLCPTRAAGRRPAGWVIVSVVFRVFGGMQLEERETRYLYRHSKLLSDSVTRF